MVLPVALPAVGKHYRSLNDEVADRLYANRWSVPVGEMEALPEEFIERTAERERAGIRDDDWRRDD